jgi:hypothetical protein
MCKLFWFSKCIQVNRLLDIFAIADRNLLPSTGVPQEARVPTLLFYQIEPYKKGPFLVLPSSIARNSSVPNAKRIFQIHQGILEGCTNRARPSRPSLKNCQNGTFLPLHGIQIFGGPNVFFWCTVKVPFSNFFPKVSQALPKCFFKWINWINWIKSRFPCWIWNILFVLSSYEFLAILEGKIG